MEQSGAPMTLVYVTGISGTGKSAICKALRQRGYDAHDTDLEGNCVWVNRHTGDVTPVGDEPAVKPDEWLDEQEWRVVRHKVEALARRSDHGTVFLCGSTANENEVWDLFSRVIYLTIDEQTLRRRLATRTSNNFGKTPKELEAILGWHKVGETDYRRLGAIIVDATLPLDEVVEKVLDEAARTKR